MDTLKQHLVQKTSGAVGFGALMILAIISWTWSASVWPGLLILILAFGYGLAVATGGSFFENLLDTGQRLLPILIGATREISTQRATPGPDSTTPIGPSTEPALMPTRAGGPQEATPADQDSALASDPTVDPRTLMRLAADRADLRPAIAANPKAYPDLLTWLGSLGDPTVDEALRRRMSS